MSKKKHTYEDVNKQLGKFVELLQDLGEEVGEIENIEKLFGRDAEKAYKFMDWLNTGLIWIKRGFAIGMIEPMIKRLMKKFVK